VLLGEMVTTSECTTSAYGDAKLQFRHQRIEEDWALRPEFLEQYDATKACGAPATVTVDGKPGTCAEGSPRPDSGSSSKAIPDAKLAELRQELESDGGYALEEGDEAYGEYSAAYASQCTERPKAIFLPKNEKGLRDVLKAVVENQVEFVVSTTRLNQDCQGTTTGYLINMRLFDDMELVKENDEVKIRLGAGTFVDEVNVFLQQQDASYYSPSLICTSGSSVGPILGGGYSWHLNYAFPGGMADNVLAFRFMDYKGESYQVDNSSHPDLFWALRGGGGQLGVVTEVVMRVSERREPFTTKHINLPCPDGPNTCTLEQRLSQMDRVGQLYNTLGDDIGLLTLWAPPPPTGQPDALPDPYMSLICDSCNAEAIVTRPLFSRSRDLPYEIPERGYAGHVQNRAGAWEILSTEQRCVRAFDVGRPCFPE